MPVGAHVAEVGRKEIVGSRVGAFDGEADGVDKLVVLPVHVLVEPARLVHRAVAPVEQRIVHLRGSRERGRSEQGAGDAPCWSW